MMFGEAVVFFKPELARYFKFVRKQGMQLHSKMRFISAQFTAMLSNDLWKRNARHANDMAARLSQELKKIPKINITQSVDANGIFVTMPPGIIPALQREQFFYVWNEKISEVRLMCSFDTTENDVYRFAEKLRQLLMS